MSESRIVVTKRSSDHFGRYIGEIVGRKQNQDRTGSDRIDKTWTGCDPTDKTRIGSKKIHKFPPK